MQGGTASLVPPCIEISVIRYTMGISESKPKWRDHFSHPKTFSSIFIIIILFLNIFNMVINNCGKCALKMLDLCLFKPYKNIVFHLFYYVTTYKIILENYIT